MGTIIYLSNCYHHLCSSIICSYEVVEQNIDDVLISSCSRNPQGGDNYGQEEWLMVEYAIREHVTENEITLDPHLFGATVNERLIR